MHWRHDRASFWFFGPLIFTVTFALALTVVFNVSATVSDCRPARFSITAVKVYWPASVAWKV